MSAGQARPTEAQIPDPKQEFSAALIGKQFVLRTFSADREARYSWTARGLAFEGDNVRAFAFLTPEKVIYRNGVVTITGHRRGAVLNSQTHQLAAYSQASEVHVVVRVGTAELSDVLPMVQRALFFENLGTALAAVPPQFERAIPPESKGGGRALACLDCAWMAVNGRWAELPQSNFKAPEILRRVSPEFSVEARRNKVSGVVLIAVSISDVGKVTELWLLRPIGSGLDEAALDAVRQYVFEPATNDGHAVGSVAQIVVRFDIV